ncbi:MAG: hypothetical protein HXL76_06420 [[Eubacterium] sulci]|nr:hypothetical protein [[Eubacterium] sulci]
MFTNSNITLYLCTKEGKLEKFTRRVVKNVYWEDVDNATFLKTGQRGSCTALVILPFSSVGKAINLTKGKDLIVKGVIDFEFDNTSQATIAEGIAKLKTNYKALTLVSVDERLYGSKSVQHYELTGK